MPRVAVEGRRHLRLVLEADDEVTLSADELNVAFDLARVLSHAHLAVDAVRHLAGS